MLKLQANKEPEAVKWWFSMAEKKKTTAKKKKADLLPFDELPIQVKRNRRLLYEYIRTGELPE